MANDFGTGKSVVILAVVAGCFAILWPNVFYPMITGNYPQKSDGYSGGCCDVIFDNDVVAIKIMSELCEQILMVEKKLDNNSILSFQEGKLTKEILDSCQRAVFDKCNLNITELLKKKNALGKDYRQNLDLVRTLNSSICLRESFGISIGRIGLPRRMRVWGVNISKHLKQERPPHLHPEMLHPALREKGRAIPQSHVVPKVVQEGRPGPIPGMRPPMGGPGHVVPPPKVGGGGTMGIVMPMYTIGIVVFFVYTMLKLMFKKSNESVQYEEFTPDSEFRREVFTNSGYRLSNAQEKKAEQNTRLVVTAITGLVQEVNKEICSKQIVDTPIIEDTQGAKEDDNELAEKSEAKPIEKSENDIIIDSDISTDEINSEESMKSSVKVMGMETTESCEGGKWSRPVIPRPPTPQNIYLSGVIPDQSQLLVTDSTTETLPQSDNAVVLSGKVTLSLIGFQDAGQQDSEVRQFEVERNDNKVETEDKSSDADNFSETVTDNYQVPLFSGQSSMEPNFLEKEGESYTTSTESIPDEQIVPLSESVSMHLVSNEDNQDDLLIYTSSHEETLLQPDIHTETAETVNPDQLSTEELNKESDLEIECEILPTEDIISDSLPQEITEQASSDINIPDLLSLEITEPTSSEIDMSDLVPHEMSEQISFATKEKEEIEYEILPTEDIHDLLPQEINEQASSDINISDPLRYENNEHLTSEINVSDLLTHEITEPISSEIDVSDFVPHEMSEQISFEINENEDDDDDGGTKDKLLESDGGSKNIPDEKKLSDVEDSTGSVSDFHAEILEKNYETRSEEATEQKNIL